MNDVLAALVCSYLSETDSDRDEGVEIGDADADEGDEEGEVVLEESEDIDD